MMLENLTGVEPIRLLFEMTRDDNPRLYDDLLRFRKGTKRVNRLRLLAHEGLIAVQEVSARHGQSPPPKGAVNSDAGTRDNRLAQARRTNQVFGISESGEAG